MPKTTINTITDQFRKGLARFAGHHRPRIGVELKLPLVQADGQAASREEVESLWRFLVDRGWDAQSEDGRLVGATRPGEQNETVGSSETGYCKTEFSLAHADNLLDVDDTLRAIRADLDAFHETSGLHFLGTGLHPVTPPSQDLRVRKQRASVWGNIFRSNTCLPVSEGDDMDLFTVNAGSHVHLSLAPEHAFDAVNVFNGFAGAQLALGANGNIWRNRIDDELVAAGELFWDWWELARGRAGVPAAAFTDLEHYAQTVADMDLLYVKRDGESLTFPERPTLASFLAGGRHPARTVGGDTVEITPEAADLDLHNSCYWFNARISRYFTVENRVHEQQPPEDLLAPAALTTGLSAALPEAREALARHQWSSLIEARPAACRHGLGAEVDGLSLHSLSSEMLEIAELGLKRRGLGEERYLSGLHERLRQRRTPSDQNRLLFEQGGAPALVAARSLHPAS